MEKKWMKRLNKWGLAKQAMKIGMFFSVVFAGIQAYKIWTYFRKFPDTFFEYGTLQAVPQELVIKTQLINTGKHLILLSLFFWILFEICSFMEDREAHWITWINNKLGLSKKFEKFAEKMEDD